jgi:cobalt-zinc-cadmium efflux system membrane fusion protein
MGIRHHLERLGRGHPVMVAAAVGALLGGLLGLGTVWFSRGSSPPALSLAQAAAAEAGSVGQPGNQAAAGSTASPSVELSESQSASIKVEPVTRRTFPIEKEAVGSIDFNQDMSVQVFTPYQGRIAELFAKQGDKVTKGQTLFTIESPDLIQAESNLIAAAGVLDLTTRALARARQLYKLQGIAQKDLEQAVSDQQGAEGALKAARDAVLVFGKTDADLDRYVKTRKIDPLLVVPCPITGLVTARNAATGLLVQPGNPPAPFTVADISTMWMLAYAPESDSPAFHLGQEVTVSVLAFPDHLFTGKITTIAENVDPNTHRVMTRSEILDPKHELRPGMLATFVIRTGDPAHAPAVPVNGVVREGDGTMTVWVTTDRHRFVQRTVKIGLQRDGYDQILDGVQPGELIAADGALFLSNKAAGGVT